MLVRFSVVVGSFAYRSVGLVPRVADFGRHRGIVRSEPTLLPEGLRHLRRSPVVDVVISAALGSPVPLEGGWPVSFTDVVDHLPVSYTDVMHHGPVSFTGVMDHQAFWLVSLSAWSSSMQHLLVVLSRICGRRGSRSGKWSLASWDWRAQTVSLARMRVGRVPMTRWLWAVVVMWIDTSQMLASSFQYPTASVHLNAV